MVVIIGKWHEKYNLEAILKQMIGDNDWVAIQGEVYGASIQGNPYKMNGRELRVFNLIYPSGRLGQLKLKKSVIKMVFYLFLFSILILFCLIQ